MTRTMAAPLVSVIVPMWNARTTIAETLASIAAQTYPALEIIIVDDGSTDGSADIAADFCHHEPRAVLISQSNTGVAGARNRGILGSRGEWIAPIDADDLWHPTKIEKQIGAARAARETPGFVYCWFRAIDESGSVLGSSGRWRVDDRCLLRLAYFNFVGNGSSPIFLRKAVVSVGGYDQELRKLGAEGCEDLLLQLEIAAHFPVVLVPEHLVGYRLRDGNMSSDVPRMMRSGELTLHRLEGRNLEVPAHVRRWARGILHMSFAQSLALQGLYRAAAASFLRSVFTDPVRGAASIPSAISYVARRLARVKTTPDDQLPFWRADPDRDMRGAPSRTAWILQRLDALRMARLAHRERRLLLKDFHATTREATITG